MRRDLFQNDVVIALNELIHVNRGAPAPVPTPEGDGGGGKRDEGKDDAPGAAESKGGDAAVQSTEVLPRGELTVTDRLRALEVLDLLCQGDEHTVASAAVELAVERGTPAPVGPASLRTRALAVEYWRALATPDIVRRVVHLLRARDAETKLGAVLVLSKLAAGERRGGGECQCVGAAG